MKLSSKLNKVIKESDPSCITKFTTTENGHKHEFKVNARGNGFTTFTYGTEDHVHEIVGNIIIPMKGHDHDIN